MESKAKVIGTFVAVALLGLVGIKAFYYFGGEFLNSATDKITQEVKVKTEELKKDLEKKIDEITPDEHAARVAKCRAVMKTYESRKEKDMILGQIHDGMNDQELACFLFLKKIDPKDFQEPKTEQPQRERSWWDPGSWF